MEFNHRLRVVLKYTFSLPGLQNMKHFQIDANGIGSNWFTIILWVDVFSYIFCDLDRYHKYLPPQNYSGLSIELFKWLSRNFHCTYTLFNVVLELPISVKK